jgi:hypothetical protein
MMPSLRKFLAIVPLAGLLLAPVPGLAATAATSEPLYQCDNLANRADGSDFGEALYQADDGWFFRESDFAHLYLISEQSMSFLHRLQDALAMRGITLFMLPVPPKAALEPEHALNAIAGHGIAYEPAYALDQFETAVTDIAAEGINVIDVYGYMKRNNLPTEGSFFKRDIHWHPSLSLASARASAEAIDKVLGPVGDKKFTTTLKSTVQYQPIISVLLRQLCSSKIPYEDLPVFETVDDDESVDTFLSDDTAAPPINVVGTSFTYETSEKFNFAGFLRDEANAEVAMYAFAGANVNQSLYRWAHNGLAATEGTKVLLWEMPYLDRFEAAVPDMERQIIPAIQGACSGTPEAIVDQDYALDANGDFELKIDPAVGVAGSDFYVSASLSDATQTQFSLQFQYDDGRVELVSIIRPDRAGPASNLFAELSPDFTASLTAVELHLPAGTALSGRIAICKSNWSQL